MSRKYRVLCGVPTEECSGGKLFTDQQLPKKAHSSREEAFRCYVKYLIKSGFKRIGPREFINPDGGRVRVIPKKSKFGGLLVTGKHEKTEAGRFMPEKRNAGNRGVIF